jgi:hypothetical protein
MPIRHKGNVTKLTQHAMVMAAKLKISEANRAPRHKVPRLLAPVLDEDDKRIAILLDRSFD